MFWVATPLLPVTLVGLVSWIWPLVTLHVTVAPATGLPLTSVAVTEIGWNACSVDVMQIHATWPLPDSTLKWDTTPVPCDEFALQPNPRAALITIWTSIALTTPSEFKSS